MHVWALVVLFVFLVLASWMDLRRRMLPHFVTYGALGVVFCLQALSGSVWIALIGAIGMAVMVVVPVLTGSVGGADLPLFMTLGAALGLVGSLATLLLTILLVRLVGKHVARYSDRYRPNPRLMVPVAPLAAVAATLVVAAVWWH
ncbi:MAG: A24 family peptidase [Firmicutes bacterium]|nr:A24 family peptidase [Bacillota bacterium]